MYGALLKPYLMNISITKNTKMNLKNMILVSSIFLLFINCSKEDASNAKIIGKWYHASTDTKIARQPDSKLKDTTEIYTKDNTASIYEFFSDGKMIITMKAGGLWMSNEAKYTLENNKMTWIFSGQSSPPITVSNLDGSNWRYEQDGRSYCTSPYTKFTEYYNFKKY